MATIKVLISNARRERVNTAKVTHIVIESFSYAPVDTVDEDSDPETVLIRKVEAIADLLGCSEAEAQRLLFARC